MWCGSGWRRPISSTSRRDCWTARAPCSPPATIRPPTTASSCAVPAPSPSARTPGWPRSARTSSPGVPAFDGPRGTISDRDVLADYGEFLRSLVDLAELRPLRGRRRRRQRHGRPHRTSGAGRDPVDHAAAVVLRTRRHLPQPRGQPAGPGQPRRPAGATSSRPAPTSDWRSTATPTGVSSSTKQGDPVSPVSGDRAGRRAGAEHERSAQR